jgi:hypothetical protein
VFQEGVGGGGQFEAATASKGSFDVDVAKCDSVQAFSRHVREFYESNKMSGCNYVDGKVYTAPSGSGRQMQLLSKTSQLRKAEHGFKIVGTGEGRRYKVVVGIAEGQVQEGSEVMAMPASSQQEQQLAKSPPKKRPAQAGGRARSAASKQKPLAAAAMVKELYLNAAPENPWHFALNKAHAAACVAHLARHADQIKEGPLIAPFPGLSFGKLGVDGIDWRDRGLLNRCGGEAPKRDQHPPKHGSEYPPVAVPPAERTDSTAQMAQAMSSIADALAAGAAGGASSSAAALDNPMVQRTAFMLLMRELLVAVQNDATKKKAARDATASLKTAHRATEGKRSEIESWLAGSCPNPAAAAAPTNKPSLNGFLQLWAEAEDDGRGVTHVKLPKCLHPGDCTCATCDPIE